MPNMSLTQDYLYIRTFIPRFGLFLGSLTVAAKLTCKCSTRTLTSDYFDSPLDTNNSFSRGIKIELNFVLFKLIKLGQVSFINLSK